MKRAALLTLALLLPAAHAAAPPVETLEAVQKRFRITQAAAKSHEELCAAHTRHGADLLAFAERHPAGPDAFRALMRCLRLADSHAAFGTPAARAAKLLARDHAAHPDMAMHAKRLGLMADDGSAAVLREVIQRHPDRRTRARACSALAKGRRELAEAAASLSPLSLTFYTRGENFRHYCHYMHVTHGTHGEDLLKLLRADASKYRAESAAMAKLLEEKYPGLCPDLSVGRPAPDVVSQGLDGKPVKLSDLKGKVVVLDIWATWCGPCREMIPHQREMVARLKDEPFALVSVSVDDSPEVLAKFLKRVPMPWAHWWNGPRSGMVLDWDVQSYPTVYVLDHKGVIRAVGVRDKEMDKVVDRLLRQMRQEKKS